MDKRLRSSLRSSASEFLTSSVSVLGSKPGRSAIATALGSLPASSDIISSLPSALSTEICRSIDAFKETLPSSPPLPSVAAAAASRRRPSSATPPSKRTRGLSSSPTPAVGTTKELLKQLHAYAYISYVCVTHPKKLFPPADLLPAARSLHDSLVLFDADAALLSQVAGLCEEWWKENLPGRELLISQSIPFLLARSLTNSKKVEVKRIYGLRDAFSMFDYEDVSIEDLRLLLVRCVIAPVYLKSDEGRKLVAFIMGLNLLLAKDLLAMMKSQIPFGRKSVLEAHAEIIFRAWKAADDDVREEIEDGFLQDLIEGAVHAASPLLVASVRKVLGGFLEQRANSAVEKLIFRLSEPVIFRSLQVANSNVRKNSLHLLLDMFPLEDPDFTKEEKESLRDKQFHLLDKLLLDDCVDVRVVAV